MSRIEAEAAIGRLIDWGMRGDFGWRPSYGPSIRACISGAQLRPAHTKPGKGVPLNTIIELRSFLSAHSKFLGVQWTRVSFSPRSLAWFPSLIFATITTVRLTHIDESLLPYGTRVKNSATSKFVPALWIVASKPRNEKIGGSQLWRALSTELPGNAQI